MAQTIAINPKNNPITKAALNAFSKMKDSVILSKNAK